jgi:hypothetical protein
MALKNKRKNGYFSCFEELDGLSEGLGDMLWNFLHAGRQGSVKHFFYQNFLYFFNLNFSNFGHNLQPET